MTHCTGDIIFLSDQDDVWFAEKIERMVVEFTRGDALMIQCDMLITNEFLKPTGQTQLASMLRLGYSRDMFVFGCCTAIRRTFLSAILPVPEIETGHDAWLCRLAIAVDGRKIIEEPLQYYRRHSSNTSQVAASNPSRVTQARLFILEMLRDNRRTWRDEIDRLDQAVRRLDDQTENFARLGFSPIRAQDSSRRMQEKMVGYRKRLKIIHKARALRLTAILSFALSGEYRQFAGWKSAVRDLIHP